MGWHAYRVIACRGFQVTSGLKLFAEALTLSSVPPLQLALCADPQPT